MKKTALVVLTDGFEEIEAITPIDLLRRAETEVTVASAAASTQNSPHAHTYRRHTMLLLTTWD